MKMLRKIIYSVGILLRNKKVFDNLNFLMKSQKWSIDSLREYQINKLKELVFHAYRNCEFYRDQFGRNGVCPQDIQSLADLKRLPITTKEDLLSNSAKIQINNYPEKLFYSETSGSSGKPLVFFRNADWDAWHRASVYRGYSWYGVKSWEKNGYFWGYNLAFKRRLRVRLLDYLQNRFRLFSYNDQEIDKFIRKLRRASYLEGYSSMIYEVARRVNEKEIKPRFNLKMIKGTSEKIFDKYQEEVEKAFGKKIISEYGAAETGIIAFECPMGKMHVNMETVIVEEENNEIIITNLVSKSFPVIRYKLGDYVELDEDVKCDCGMQRPLIKEVLGRVGKVIYGSREEYPSLTLYYVFKNLAIEHGKILNYQATQRTKGILEVAIENSLHDREKELIVKEFKKYFKDDLDVQIKDDVHLRSIDRKKTDFISHL
mgnify:CR=1 FL=1